jgi:alpha-beta hydrolase superfamily lysophospholipase
MAEDPTPRLAVRESRGETRAVVLVLHGGQEHSMDRAGDRQLAALRMLPFTTALRQAGRPYGVAVWNLGYRYRGWNGPEASPVPDARWALDQVRERHGDLPVVLVGHSMGARTALRVAGDPLVRGVAALAPWVPAGEPVEQLAGRRLLIMHGTRDTTTSPRASRAYAERAEAVAEDVVFVEVPGECHAMLRRPERWHRAAAGFTLSCLGHAPMPAR